MRFRPPTREEMSEAQLRVVEAAIAGKRGTAPAPLLAWLDSPELGERAQRLGEFVRYDTTLPPALSELAILVTARFWTSHYEWHAHKREGLKAGIDPTVIDAIARRKPPKLQDPKAQLVYDFSMALHETHAVPAPLFAAAQKELGRQGVVELIGILGYYTLISMTLNAFEIGLPDGAAPELQP
ncbi:4-carboxymuconolactone decarboxylase [Rhizobiales bacterium GAS191]|jgi:4-carboxymuconolactone decarboxylase|nr:4-carboxymuconolactone decarboxylase [Rhizobiales bacterium GAS113]SEC21820.1 4-carboxymuconolactone decarboxylase [Rhizobiales bacterium GAS188]SED02622.1 4-carboxymuconolactone decarboxylase [Rhizobiales bacterium GAS191]